MRNLVMNWIVIITIQLLIIIVSVLIFACKFSYVFPYSHCEYVALDPVDGECLQRTCIYLLYISLSDDCGKPFGGVGVSLRFALCSYVMNKVITICHSKQCLSHRMCS